MAVVVYHPKNGAKCVFCKRWNGDANLVFKNPQMGYQFTTGVYGKCMKTGGNVTSTSGQGCKNYEPSPEADKLL